MGDILKFTGRFEKYYSTKGNFSMAKFVLVDSKRKYIDVLGNISHTNLRFYYEITGQWEVSGNKNIFKIDSFRNVTGELESESFWVDYFSSDIFAGIGKVLAKNIYKHYGGGKILEKINNNLASLLDVEGMDVDEFAIIKAGLSESIIEKWRSFFIQYNLSSTYLDLLINIYNSDEEKIQTVLLYRNYEFYTDMRPNISFRKIDEIELTIASYWDDDIKLEDFIFSPRRMAFLLAEAVKNILNLEGHTYIDYNSLVSEFNKKIIDYYINYIWDLFEVKVERIDVYTFQIGEKNYEYSKIFEKAKEYAAVNKILYYKIDSIIKREMIFTKHSYEEEIKISDYIYNLINSTPLKTKFKDFESAFVEFNNSIVKKYSNYMENQIGFGYSFDEHMKKCFEIYFKYNLIIISGGPGRGKSTLIKFLIEWHNFLFEDVKDKIVLTPTGRAAANINDNIKEYNNYKKSVKEELINISAQTIHRFLGYDGRFDSFLQTPSDDSSMLIVDECSMIDQKLFASLISAINLKKKLILIGDVDQLPCIGYGDVYRNIIEACPNNFIELIKNYRSGGLNNNQNVTDQISEICDAIKTGNINKFVVDEKSNINFVDFDNWNFVKEELSKVYKKIIDTNSVKDSESVKNELSAVQVLSPFNTGEAGVEDINLFLRDISNSKNRYTNLGFYAKDEKGKSKQFKYREFDKIMCFQNQYDIDLLNGDVGYVDKQLVPDFTAKKVKKDYNLDVCFKEKKISLSTNQLSNIKLGYACTIHKSQGSEYDNVIIVIRGKSAFNFINKNMIYTAVSRAKKNVYIFCKRDVFNSACSKTINKRNTKLAIKIIKH